MSILGLIVAIFAQATPDVPHTDPALQMQSGDGAAGAVQTGRSSPLESRSTVEWRRFFVRWRQQAVAAVPAAYPLAGQDLALLGRVRDAQAVPALVALLKQERDLRVRAAYVDALGRIETTLAVQTLVAVSLDDKTDWLQQLAAKQIAKMPNRDEAIGLYARAIRAGQHRDRALESLKISGLTSPRSSSEPLNPTLTTALIDALWVPEIEWVERLLYYEGTSPNPMGDGSFNIHWGYRRGFVPVEKRVKHPVVLETIQRYTGKDYGYDQDAWRAWYGTYQQATRPSSH